MIIQFTLLELMLFLVCALGIAILIISIPVILNVKKIVKSISFILEGNQKDIKVALKNIPEIIKNTDQAINNINVISEDVKNIVPGILVEVDTATKSAKESIENASIAISRFGLGNDRSDSDDKEETAGFMSYVRIIEEIVEIIYRACSMNK